MNVMAVTGDGAQEERTRTRPGRWLALVCPHRNPIFLCAGLLLAEGAVALLVPRFAGGLVHGFITENSTEVPAVALFLVLFVLAWATAGVCTRYLLGAVAEDVVADLRLAVYRRLQAVPVRFYEHRARSELASLLTEDTEVAGRCATEALVSAPPLLALCIGAGTMLVYLSPPLGLVAVAAVALFVGLGCVASRRGRPLAGAVEQLRADGSALAEAHLRVLRTARALGAEAELARQFNDLRRRTRFTGKRAALGGALGEPVARGAGALATILVLWAVSSDLAGRGLEAGGVVEFLLYGAILVRPLGRLTALYGELRRALAATSRIDALLAEPVERGGDYVPPAGSVKGRISLRDVCFGYPGQERLLSNLSLDVEPGEVVAITGANGVGKTTLLHLIMGYARPQAGSVLLDGVDLWRWNLTELRRGLSLVPHEMEFLPVSVRSNITLGTGGADLARLDWALEVAVARDVVARLPGGLDARLGPGGEILSTGQAQRIALARALYKRAPVLLLDEPTAMFDEHAESTFVQRARSELRSTTVLLVTHRPQTLALADRVLRLGGKTPEPVQTSGKVIQGPWTRV